MFFPAFGTIVQAMEDRILFNPSAFKHVVYMTDEEADALDEELTVTVPELGPNGEGFFSGKGYQMIALDKDTARILNARALSLRRWFTGNW